MKVKAVRQEKRMPLKNWRVFDDDKRRVLRELDEARAEKRKIIYLDETCFTKLSMLNKAYSGPGDNIKVDQKQVMQGYRASCVAVSEEKGLEMTVTQETAFDGEDFIKCL